ncbi:uncharacterized protein [Henckelia pumila]|uniref:uncharacterized protein isoform X2 n=1 Tax=Henckelia pumila TaxID=405737 RepID=UPI003C6DD918
MSSSPPPCEARQLILPKLLHTSTPHLSSLLYDPKSSSLAFRHFDSSFSVYPCVNLLNISSFPSPQTLIPSPTSSATFLHLQTSPESTTTIFLTCSPVVRPSSSTLLRFYLLRDDRFGKIKVLSSHRDLEWDQGKGGMLFKTNHGISMKLSGGINVFSLYSVSNSKIWVFAVRLIGDHDGAQALKLMKCALIDCCFPIFEIKVLFGFLILGEENGVRVFPLRPLVKGRQRKEKKSVGKRLNLHSGSSNGGKTLATDGELNLLSVKGEKSERHNDSAKLRFTKLRQDSKDTGGVFVAFEDKDFNGSVSVKMPGKSVKAISVEALSANKFVILDSIGNLHVLCLSSSLHGLDTGCVMRQSTQTMKVLKMAVFHDVSADGCYTVHLMAVSGVDASVDESEVEDTDEKLVKTSVTQAILTSEKIHDIVPMDANAILILGQVSPGDHVLGAISSSHAKNSTVFQMKYKVSVLGTPKFFLRLLFDWVHAPLFCLQRI